MYTYLYRSLRLLHPRDELQCGLESQKIAPASLQLRHAHRSCQHVLLHGPHRFPAAATRVFGPGRNELLARARGGVGGQRWTHIWRSAEPENTGHTVLPTRSYMYPFSLLQRRRNQPGVCTSVSHGGIYLFISSHLSCRRTTYTARQHPDHRAILQWPLLLLFYQYKELPLSSPSVLAFIPLRYNTVSVYVPVAPPLSACPPSPCSLLPRPPELIERGACAGHVRLQVLTGLQPLEERIRPMHDMTRCVQLTAVRLKNVAVLSGSIHAVHNHNVHVLSAPASPYSLPSALRLCIAARSGHLPHFKRLPPCAHLTDARSASVGKPPRGRGSAPSARAAPPPRP